MRVWLENYLNGILNKLINQYSILLKINGISDVNKKEFEEVIIVLVSHKIRIQQILDKQKNKRRVIEIGQE